jgi:hypothetical protein
MHASANHFPMKLILRTLCLVAAALSPFSLAHANPTLVDQYLFQNSLADSIGSNPILNTGGAVLGNGMLTFGKNQGPTVSVSPELSANYSIGLQFQLSLPNADGDPWTSIVNLSNLEFDNWNQYLYNGNPYFYSIGGEFDDTSKLVPSDTVVDMIMTWDGTNYAAYLNGSLVDSFSEPIAGNAIVIGEQTLFSLFNDDGHGAEATSGVLYQVDVWQGVLTPQQAADFNFESVTRSAPDAGSLIGAWVALLGAFEVARRRLARA